jgi:hypothetical protein
MTLEAPPVSSTMTTLSAVAERREVGPVPSPARPPDDALLLEQGEAFRGRGGVGAPAAEGFPLLERHLEGRALEVVHEDVGVVGIDPRLLRAPAEEVFRVGDDVLVQGRGGGDQYGEGDRAPSPGPARLLPEAGEGAGEAGHDGGVEAAYVYAQLERVGRYDSPYRALSQALLDGPALAREEASPIGAHLDALVPVVGIGQGLGDVGGDELDLEPGSGEEDGLDPCPEELERYGLGLGRRALPDPLHGVD